MLRKACHLRSTQDSDIANAIQDRLRSESVSKVNSMRFFSGSELHEEHKCTNSPAQVDRVFFQRYGRIFIMSASDPAAVLLMLLCVCCSLFSAYVNSHISSSLAGPLNSESLAYLSSFKPEMLNQLQDACNTTQTSCSWTNAQFAECREQAAPGGAVYEYYSQIQSAIKHNVQGVSGGGWQGVTSLKA